VNQTTSTIRTIADDLDRSLGSAFSEEVHDRAMQVGLRLEAFTYESQKVLELKYRDHYIGDGYPDLLCRIDNRVVVVELKARGKQNGCVTTGTVNESAN
jgi:GxxExxY protein